jgi:uncharacterized protein YndB with AHSA1/START domain
MKTNETQFQIDRESFTIQVEREFSAEKERLWRAWTDSKILDKWWAPKPWTSETTHLEVVEEGKRIYSMNSPEGDRHWSMQEFIAIRPNQNLKFKDFFCEDENTPNEAMPSSEWDVKFQDFGQNSKLNISIHHGSAEDLDRILEMGFLEGFSMCLRNLDEVLENR